MSFLLAEGLEVLPDETQNAIIICALLHDLGKMGDYGKPNYVPNMIKSRKKDENGEYPLVQSEAKPYEINKELLYIPHEVRSIAIAERFIKLTEEEEQAILGIMDCMDRLNMIFPVKKRRCICCYIFLTCGQAELWRRNNGI